jgi:glutathione S-transferase
VPVIVHGETPVSELGAIAIYLADNFSSSGLAPAPTAPLRAAFLRWVFFSSAIMEPCLGEKFFNWNLPAVSMAWGSFEHMMATLEPALETGPYLLGDQFSAADVLVGSTLRFGHMFGAIPNEGVTKSYAERLAARGAFKRASEIEAREGERFPAPPSD